MLQLQDRGEAYLNFTGTLRQQGHTQALPIFDTTLFRISQDIRP